MRALLNRLLRGRTVHRHNGSRRPWAERGAPRDAAEIARILDGLDDTPTVLSAEERDAALAALALHPVPAPARAYDPDGLPLYRPRHRQSTRDITEPIDLNRLRAAIDQYEAAGHPDLDPFQCRPEAATPPPWRAPLLTRRHQPTEEQL